MGKVTSKYQTSEQELKRKDPVVALQLEDKTKPTVKELDDKLGNLVDWERFALHLQQITQTDIDIIKRDNPLNTASQKQALFNKWLRLYPNASWEHVITALETVGENNIAQTIQQCLPEAALSPQKQLTPREEIIQKATLQTLSELHELFAKLLFECQLALKELVQNRIVTLSDLVDRVKAERAYKFEDLDGIEDGNQFFTVISQHYHFLDTHLLVVLAKQFLNPSKILEKLLAHVEKTKAFKKQTEIRSLHKTLQPFVIRSSNEVPVTIKVQNAWEHNEIWLVETLLQTMFHLKDNETPKWFRVIPGSLTIIFLVPQHKILSLTELSKNKVQFLRLTGVFTLQIGEEYILQDEENEAYSFTQALIEATEAGNYEAVQFLELELQEQGYASPQAGYPPQQGYPSQPPGYPPRGYPQQQPPYPAQGYPPQGYPPQEHISNVTVGPPTYTDINWSTQPPMVQQQPSRNVVIVQQQPTYTVYTPPRPVSDNFLVLSIVLTLICFLVCNWYGLLCTIPAIIFSIKAQDAQRHGDDATARTKARVSLGLNITAVVCWIMIILGLDITITVFSVNGSRNS